jgi:hypothetical protein
MAEPNLLFRRYIQHFTVNIDYEWAEDLLEFHLTSRQFRERRNPFGTCSDSDLHNVSICPEQQQKTFYIPFRHNLSMTLRDITKCMT